MADQKHIEWLLQGVNVWNERREPLQSESHWGHSNRR